MSDLLGEDHEGHDVTWRGTRSTWEGDYAIETHRFTCSCGSRISVEIRTDVGPPSGETP